jgi:membrane protein
MNLSETGTRRGSRARKVYETFCLVARESGRALVLNQHLDTAALLSYYAFLAMAPLLLLLVVVASQYLVGIPRFLDTLQGVSLEIFPGFGKSLVTEIQRLSNKGIWSFLSLAVLLWSITPFAAALRSAFKRIFRPGHSSNFLKDKTRDLLGALMLIALALLLVAGQLAYGTLAARLHHHLAWGWEALNIMANLSIAVAGLAFFYVVFTPVRLRAVEIVGGALAAALLLFMFQPAFAWFIKFNPQYGFAFGSLKAIFLLFTWVYFSFVAILFGAEIIAAANRREILLLQPLLKGETVAQRIHGVLVEKFVRSYLGGEAVFNEGDLGDDMFYIRKGSVELRHAGHILQTLHEGEYFGEMSMLIDTPRTASAQCLQDGTELIVIARNNFDTLLRDNPSIGQSILLEMARRLKAANERAARVSAGPAG